MANLQATAADLLTICQQCEPFGNPESGKVFIIDVYHFSQFPGTLAAFKALLLELRDAGLLRLMNLEFRQTTPLKTITESRTVDRGGYEFHLICTK